MTCMVDPASVARLRRAVRSLDAPPSGPGWNAGELAESLPGSDPVRRGAAVLVPFVPRNDALSILFTRRNEHLRQHAGQISFPGGAIEHHDANVIAAALRETEEEVGIKAQLVEPFGYLDCLDTMSGYCVTPVVGLVRDDYSVRLQSEEVDDVFEVPFGFILDPANLRREKFLWRGVERDIIAFEWRGRRIWGVTASILKNLLDRWEHAAW